MSSENQSSPASKRPRSASPEAANSPTTPASNKKLKTKQGHDMTPDRLLKSNKKLGKAVSDLKNTIELQNARIVELKRVNAIQLTVIELVNYVDMLDELLAASSESSQSSGSTEHSAHSQEEEEAELDRDDGGEPDNTT